MICGSFTKTVISDDEKTFTVSPVNIAEGKTVIIALYNGNRLVEAQTAVYEGEIITFTTDKEYTGAKVMVWNELTSIMPGRSR